VSGIATETRATHPTQTLNHGLSSSGFIFKINLQDREPIISLKAKVLDIALFFKDTNNIRLQA
jgi:hypothetical protein